MYIGLRDSVYMVYKVYKVYTDLRYIPYICSSSEFHIFLLLFWSPNSPNMVSVYCG